MSGRADAANAAGHRPNRAAWPAAAGCQARPAPPSCCSSNVQAKVRRNGRGGWSKQEVRIGRPEFAPGARQLSRGGLHGGGGVNTAASWLQRQLTSRARAARLCPAGRAAAPHGGAVWRQELEKDRCGKGGGRARQRALAGTPRASRAVWCRLCSCLLVPGLDDRGMRQLGQLEGTGATASLSRPPATSPLDSCRPYRSRRRHRTAAAPPSPRAALRCLRPCCSRALCGPHRRAVPSPVAEGAEPRGAQGALDP